MAVKVDGAMVWRAFAHKAKLRIEAGSGDQSMRVSGWPAKTNGRVDTARANWPGLVGVQKAAGVYDPRPRLVKAKDTDG